MRSILLVAVAVLVALPLGAVAADREARMVDTAGVNFMSYRDMRMPVFNVSGEVDIFKRSDRSFILRGGAGPVSSDAIDSQMFWFVSGSFKRRVVGSDCYAFSLSYEAVDSGDAHQVLTGMFSYQIRFNSVEEPISPYLKLNLGLQDAKSTDWTSGTDSFIAMLMRTQIGCDVELRKNVAMVFSAAFTDTSDFGESPYGGYADGWDAGIALKYYYH